MLISGIGGGGGSLGIYASSQTTGQSSSSTINGGSLSVVGAGIISIGLSQGSLLISAPGSTGISQSLYATGNTTQSSSGTASIGSLLVQGVGNVSVGVSNGSLVISGAGGGGGGGGIFAGVSNLGNAAGSTGTVSTGNVVFVGSGPISLSQSTGAAGSAATITINGPIVSTLTGAGGITLSTAAGVITISAPATSSLIGQGGISVSTAGSTISVYPAPLTRYIHPYDNALTTIGALGNATLSIQYIQVPMALTASRLDVLMSMSFSTSAGAGTQTYQYSGYGVVYTKNVSTLSSLSSGSTQSTYTLASNSAGNTQFTQAAIRPLSIPLAINMSAGEYYIGVNIITANTAGSASFSVMGGPSMIAGMNYAEMGAVTGTSTNYIGGMGLYSAATTGTLANVSLSAINATGASLQAANVALVFRNA